jgi:DNA-binding GntR family transcriptional regulator
MPPGFMALEAEIALRLGMSRTPVREALIRLEKQGLVEFVPRRGIRVKAIAPDDMREIYDILTALEPQAAASVASKHPTAEQLTELDVATSDMERALKSQDREAWAEADDQFHRKLLELNNNRRLLDFVSVLLDQAHRARMFTLRVREMPVKSTEEHRRILDALVSGDVEKAHTVFRLHRQRAASELLELLERCKLTQL